MVISVVTDGWRLLPLIQQRLGPAFKVSLSADWEVVGPSPWPSRPVRPASGHPRSQSATFLTMAAYLCLTQIRKFFSRQWSGPRQATLPFPSPGSTSPDSHKGHAIGLGMPLTQDRRDVLGSPSDGPRDVPRTGIRRQSSRWAVFRWERQRSWGNPIAIPSGAWARSRQGWLPWAVKARCWLSGLLLWTGFGTTSASQGG